MVIAYQSLQTEVEILRKIDADNIVKAKELKDAKESFETTISFIMSKIEALEAFAKEKHKLLIEANQTLDETNLSLASKNVEMEEMKNKNYAEMEEKAEESRARMKTLVEDQMSKT